MRQKENTNKDLNEGPESLRERLEAAEEVVRAIRAGEVDAVVIKGPHGDQVFTLQGADQPYRVLVESMQEGAATLSAQGLILYSNRRFADMLKLSLEKVLGVSIRDFIAPTNYGLFKRMFRHSQAASSHGEITLRAADNTPVPAYLALNALPLSESTAICLVATDLTDQKHMEEATRRLIAEQAARAEAEAAQRRFAFLTEVSTLLATSLDYDRIYDNVARLLIPRFADHFVVDLLDKQGTLRCVAVADADPDGETRLHEPVKRIPPDPPNEAVLQVLESRKPLFLPDAAPAWYSDHAHLLQHTTIRSFMLLPLVIRDQAIGILSLARVSSDRQFTTEDLQLADELARRIAQAVDNARLYAEIQASAETLQQNVTERTAALQQALERAQNADQAKARMIANVSHEMRTPLSSIIGFTGLLLRRALSPEDQHNYVQIVNGEGRRLLALIDDFLDFQELASRTTDYHFEPFDLAALLEEVVTAQEPDKNPQCALRLDITGPQPVYADKTRIRQVIENLLSNAIKYSPDGGDIILSLCRQDQGILFSIQDHGLGIPPEELPQLFERFQRGELAERLRMLGTGMGLALCKEIIQAHHGRIWAESAGLHQGAIFCFFLPCDSPNADTLTGV